MEKELQKEPTLTDLEKEMLKLPQVECDLTHNFAPGVYVRELFIPKDSWIMGKRHRYETCNMILKGECSVYMGEEEPPKRIKAPFLFTSKPMTKKMCYFHEETIFVNIHPTKETDLVKIENEFIIPEEEYLLLSSNNTKHIEQGGKQ